MPLTSFPLLSLILQTFSLMNKVKAEELMFLEIGKTAASATYGHLTLEVDIDVFINHTESVKTYVRQAHHSLNEIREKKKEATLSLFEDLGGVPGAVNSYSQKLYMFKHLFHEANTREKRQVTAIALGLASIVNFGVSAYSLSELQTISADVDRLDDEVTYIATQLDATNLKINRLETDMTTMAELTRQIVIFDGTIEEEFYVSQLVQNVTRTVALYQSEMDDSFTALIQLMDRRLSPLLLNPCSLMKAFADIKRKAKKHNLQPIIEDPSLLLGCDTSVISQTGKLEVIVHVPLISGESLRLLKALDFPIHVSNMAYHFRPKESILAINNAETVIKSMTPKDLDQCDKFGNIYHCQKFNILSKDLKGSCMYEYVSSLYIKDG